MSDLKRHWQGFTGNETRQRLGQCHSNTRLAEAVTLMVPTLRDVEVEDDKTTFALVHVRATVPVPVDPKEVSEWLSGQMLWIVPVPVKVEFAIRRRARGP